MRLLIATFDPPENVGGVEGRARAYTRELARAGHFVDVIALAPGYSFTSTELEGGELHRYPSSLGKLPRAFRSAAGEIGRRSVDSVFLLSGALTLFGLTVLLHARLSGRRSAIFIYGKDILGARGSPLERVLFVAASLLAGRVAVNSRFTAGLLPSFLSPKVGILYPGVDPTISRYAAKREGAASGRKRVLFVGRLVERKGADDLLAAVASLPKELDVELEVVGDGPDRERLEGLARSPALAGRVAFLGMLRGESLFARYSLADVVAMPSRATAGDVEGFGTVFLEAGLFGKPSVGTRSGGIPEAIVDGETGILVPERDVPALAAALRRLLLDDGERLRMGEEARRRVLSDFTWAKSAERLAALLGS